MAPTASTKVIASLAAVAALAATPGAAASVVRESAPPRHEYRVDTRPATGTFHCGDLRLKVTGGTETETTEGDLRNGIWRVAISRAFHHLTLAGSDGRTYRAFSVTAAWFVLDAPDFEHPRTGREMIVVVFRGGPDKSPGYLRENLVIRNGHETDTVTGPCDFG
ncbi:MAG: hypothetical protein ABIQ15_08055 [Nocardioides sp.]